MDYQNSHLNYCLTVLKIDSLQEFAAFLQEPVDKITAIKDVSQELSQARQNYLALSEEEKHYEGMISTLYYTLHSLVKKQFPRDLVVQSLSRSFPVGNNHLTLLEIIKSTDPQIRYSWSNAVEELYLERFTLLNIGVAAPEFKLINKRIAEEIFSRPVEIKEKWIYSDGGDYTVPEVQMRTEVYSDGSGENWERLLNYCQDLSAAWEIVEFLGSQGVQIRLSNKALRNEYWWCYMDDVAVQASTAPEAICLAALKLKNPGT